MNNTEHEISDSESGFPELPTIVNATLRNEIFTHRSLNGRCNNERLAFLGSHTLTQIAAAKLYDTDPILSKGELTMGLQDIVNTTNIAIWAGWYRLTDQLKCLAANRESLISNPNVKAQIFHAYLGAFFLEDRMAGAEDWIRSLINHQNSLSDSSDTGTERGSSFQSSSNRSLAPETSETETDSISSTEVEVESGASETTATMVNDPTNYYRPLLNRNPPPRTASPAFVNGSNALSRLNEGLQQGRIPPINWESTPQGAAHNQLWIMKATINGQTFTSELHKKQKDAKLDAATKALRGLGLN